MTIHQRKHSVSNNFSADYGYVALGQAGFATVFDDVYQYNPANNSWDTLPVFSPGGRAWAAGFAFVDDIYIGTGWNFSTFYKDLYMLDVTTGISTTNNQLKNVFAYQSHGNIVVEYSNEDDEFTGVELIDVQGKVIKKADIVTSGNGRQKFYIPCNGIPTGIYFLRVSSANESVSCKILIHEF